MTPKEIANELIRTRADIDQTRACLEEVHGRLDHLHEQINTLIEALEARRRQSARWQMIQLITSTLVFAVGIALLFVLLGR